MIGAQQVQEVPQRYQPAPFEFRHSESKDFWKRIHPASQQDPGELDEKSFGNIRRLIETEFPNAPRLTKNLKFLKRCLIGENADEHASVGVRSFIQTTKWFGPLARTENSCVFLNKIDKLTSYTIKQGNWKVSPFAGRLTQEKAESCLLPDDVDVGSYLVRFSESHADEGGFSLAVKANAAEIRHYNIQGDQSSAFEEPYDARLKLIHQAYEHMNAKEEMFSDIVDFMDNRLDSVIEDNICCKRVCPNLPYNALFRGYD